MSERQFPAVRDVYAYWRDNAVRVALHGETYADDRRIELTPAQALQLAEALTRAAREALTP